MVVRGWEPASGHNRSEIPTLRGPYHGGTSLTVVAVPSLNSPEASPRVSTETGEPPERVSLPLLIDLK